ncbi:hypothetical protein C366_05690 [Cryptococcus neoformans Tu401-1]|uniref:Uncharacterized protein n=1 Tax=Cryptococcus neoformans Tu259-1 TaxID=1230072 RepID=A0A854Q5J3_CRYNE|nr:hypothetical protein C366_05690 [Cryptococcus neoformans var. grubii Tu401-1]OXG13908.1 hypothetical protein C361_06055 [Cryptococcus neoformans var. grubii Tu259-1]OXM77087.1 hypothetical protein C364_05603 [Cryptococcus neoformans var. grubii Bt63]
MIITSATDGSPIVPTAGVLRHLVALTIGTRHPGMREALNDTTGPMSEFHQALQAVESSGVSEVTGQSALTAGEGGSKVQDFGLSSTSIPVATAATPSEVNAQVIQHEQLAHFHQAATQKRVKDNSNRPNGLDEFIIEHTPRCLQTTGEHGSLLKHRRRTLATQPTVFLVPCTIVTQVGSVLKMPPKDGVRPI